MSDASIHLLTFLLPLLIPAIFISIMALLSRMGWQSWARRYPAPPPTRSTPSFHCHRLTLQSPWLSYNNITRIRFLPQGVEIRFVLRLFHPPLLLPYSLIHHLRPAGFLRPFPSLVFHSDLGDLSLTLTPSAQAALRTHHHLPQ